MVSVTCPCEGCKYNGRNNKCKANKINLTYDMEMVNENRVDTWVCNKFTLREESKQLLETFERVMKERMKNDC